MLQADLFAVPSPLPEGFRQGPDILSADEEISLVRAFAALAFRPYEFRGYQAHRQVVAFGSTYDQASRQVRPSAPIPEFLLPLRATAAAFAKRPAEAFEQVLINQYPPGAAIGWHRDRPHFGEVVGVSLLAPCRFRLRRKAGDGWERRAIDLEARSIYLMSGPARHEWEHSIPPVEALRYSITFRTLADRT